MESKNRGNIILILVIIIFLIITIILGFLNMNLNNDLSDTRSKLNMSNSNLQENITKLSEKNEMLNNSKIFFEMYITGLGTYYSAIELQESSDYWYSKALGKYNEGYWSSALGWFWDSMDRYTNAEIKYDEAKEIFKNATSYTDNVTYQNICTLYYDIMNTNSIGIVYLYEACNYYADSCNYYLDNDYENAHNSRDNAENKITFYNTELIKIDDYQLELQELLMNIL